MKYPQNYMQDPPNKKWDSSPPSGYTLALVDCSYKLPP